MTGADRIPDHVAAYAAALHHGGVGTWVTVADIVRAAGLGRWDYSELARAACAWAQGWPPAAGRPRLMDVPASRLRRSGELHPDAARLKHMRIVTPGPKSLGCQVCGGSRDQPLVVIEPIIDHSNGQRITIAICRACIARADEVSLHTVAPARRR